MAMHRIEISGTPKDGYGASVPWLSAREIEGRTIDEVATKIRELAQTRAPTWDRSKPVNIELVVPVGNIILNPDMPDTLVHLWTGIHASTRKAVPLAVRGNPRRPKPRAGRSHR